MATPRAITRRFLSYAHALVRSVECARSMPVNYSEVELLWLYFPLLVYKLISLFIFLLHTFAIGEKTSGRLHQERTFRRHYAVAFLQSRAGVLKKLA